MNVRTPGIAPTPAMSERKVGLICALLVAIGPISMAVYTPAMTELVEVFGTTEAMIKLSLTSYFAGFAIAQLFCGPLSDGYGRKAVTFAFMAIYLAASIAAILAPSVEALVAARCVQGVGAAVGVAIARAIVRDMYTSDQSARVMNFIGLVMGLGPAMSPTVGGILTGLFGWQAVFIFMVVAGAILTVVVRTLLVETSVPDPSRIRPAAMIASYRDLLANRYFMSSSFVLGAGIGAFYTQATILPFILMERVGMSAVEFGIGMLLQSGSFFVGGLVTRRLLKRYGAKRIVPLGFACVLLGSALLAVLLRIQEPSYLNVMVPIGLHAFGMAFVLPAISTATVAAFPHMAGSASAVAGFLQMGGGLVGGLLAAALGNPTFAMATVTPAMGLLATLSWLYWRRLPEPALARVIVTRETEHPPT
ncbi:MAG: multidrug effflux MFS transporter [Rhizobiaceae bacterium]|nr:multidrug effflux MFS transporter [Rhizobiaceae bacterium]